MMWIEYTHDCCGVDELCGIHNSTPETVVGQVFNYYAGDNPHNLHTIKNQVVPFLFFAVPPDIYNGGEMLYNYIKDHKLGKCYRTGAKRNPNSGNMLRAYLWEISVTGMQNWKKIGTRSRRRSGRV